ncbi:MAG: beta-galactosidase [Thermotogae bacterium]|nr:beta-galactosidase [Thermotogota bacterium]MCL5032701.1 beta-galactosidase [Thermotogota bacterium]
MDKFFPIAVWYGENQVRAPMMPRTKVDVERTKRDLENIKNLGFNTVRYWVDWATCEKAYDQYDFKQVNDFLDLVNEYELKVIIQIYLDSAPNWLAARYPDALYISHTGHEVESQASPGYSLDHPAVRERAAKFMKALAGTVKGKANFYGWDVWSEPHIVNWSWFSYMGVEPWFDYNEYSQQRFRNWLKGKYNSIDRLNEKWYRTYISWNEVKAPRYVTLSSFKDLMDWQEFNIEKLQEDLLWRTKIIKEIDPDHVVSSHSGILSLYESPIGGSPDDWKMAKVVDVWGTSFYPKHLWPRQFMPLDYVLKGFELDVTRCSSQSNGKDFWIGELQSGHGVVGMNFGEPVKKEDVMQWAWLAISRGAKGLCYYAYYPMSCGEEISGFGLVHPDGALTDRAKAAGKVGKIIDKNKQIFTEVKPLKSDVAIIYNIYSYMMLSALQEKENELIFSSMLGLYRFLIHSGIQTDFVTMKEIEEGVLKNYKVVFAPFSIALDQQTADAIKKYVKEGGIFVSEFRPGWSDKEGNGETKIPGMGLDEIFGCYETWWRKSKETKINFEDKDFGDLITLNNNYEEAFELTNGKIIGKFTEGSPAIVMNNFGKGKAIVIGTLLSREYERTKNTKFERFFERIMEISKIESYFKIENPQESFVEVRTMKSGNGYLSFVFNHDNLKKISMKVTFNGMARDYSVYDIVNEHEVPHKFSGNSIAIEVDLAPSEVYVLKIE